MTDRYDNEIDIAEFDRQDGLLPPSLRPLFIPEYQSPLDHQTEDNQPPVAVQALAGFCLVITPFWFDILLGVL